MSYSTGAELSVKRKGRISKENALEKIYIAKAKKNNKTYSGYINVPKSLVGERLKLVLLEKNSFVRKEKILNILHDFKNDLKLYLIPYKENDSKEVVLKRFADIYLEKLEEKIKEIKNL